jgi:multidrug efflux pump subunit AcrB
MKSVIRWAISNTPAMNTLMGAILIIGLAAGFMLRREEFPRFELEIVLVTVPYPGASPAEVETGVCQKIEEAVRSIDGIKKVTSVAAEGTGSVVIEIKSDAPSVQKILGEVEAEIDRIPSFPELAEEPEIKQLTLRNPAIKVGVVAIDSAAADAEVQLRDVVERVCDDLLLIPEISVAEIQGERDYQIDVEISEETLRKYGLSLQEVARRIRQQNLELPGGTIRDDAQDFLLRGQNKRVRGEEIAKLPLVTLPSGVRLTVGDLGIVRDEFVDTPSISRINGRPGLAISIQAAAREDLLAMTEAVREYAAMKELPAGYEFALWADRSIDVNERLDLLKKNGLSGLILVFLVLALFLELRLAFWVALGIPIAVLGACGVLWQFDQTLNMLSMFAFLIALGIVVDDAIVIGENIYSHREEGKSFVRAAIDGTVEVIPSVTTSVATTIFAFLPMFFVTGVMGKFFAVMPIAVVAMLVISLIESTLVLPCHLAHDHRADPATFAQRARRWRSVRRAGIARWVVGPALILLGFMADIFGYPFQRAGDAVHWVNARVSRLLAAFVERLYLPTLRFCIQRPAVVLCTAAAVLLFSLSFVTSGRVPWVIMPELDAKEIEARIVFPDGTPSHVTDRATQRLEQAILAIDQRSKEAGEPLVRLTYRLVGQVTSQSPGGPQDLTAGGHAGIVQVALTDNQVRTPTSQEIVDQWRKDVGEFPGAESLSFGSLMMGPGGAKIEFKLLSGSGDMAELEAAVEACKSKLATYPGVRDISDDSRPGKWEMQLTVREDADALGVPLQALAGTVRAAYYGEEVMRVQRGRHEVKIMVRYPQDDRRSLAEFSDVYVDTGDGVKRPITELANVHVERGYSEINRVNQRRSITVTADVDERRAVADEIVSDMDATFIPQLQQNYPGIGVRWEGQQEQSEESINSLLIGLGIALIAMFALLTLEFSSYVQPAIVMAVIPFGMVGALWGHVVMGLPLTLFSMLGMVALTGVVVNDSIVLVDFINARLREGMPLGEALMESGRRRLRPVLLTSLTTIAGLLPILIETSLQAQILIPMANSLCFGLLFSTTLVLLLVPTFYSIYGQTFIGRLKLESARSSEASAEPPTPPPPRRRNVVHLPEEPDEPEPAAEQTPEPVGAHFGNGS